MFLVESDHYLLLRQKGFALSKRDSFVLHLNYSPFLYQQLTYHHIHVVFEGFEMQTSLSRCDIAFNFLIGGDGNVYEGVGWNFMGSHTKGHNNRSLGIAFVGTFSTKLPNDRQIEAFQKLIHVGIALEKVERNHTVMAFCQLATVSSSPGWALAHNLTSWKNFDRSLPIQCTKPPAAAKNKEEL